MMTEPRITINGHALSEGQAMTVRVAIQALLISASEQGFGNDEHGRTMTEHYRQSCTAVNHFMHSEAWPAEDDESAALRADKVRLDACLNHTGGLGIFLADGTTVPTVRRTREEIDIILKTL